VTDGGAADLAALLRGWRERARPAPGSDVGGRRTPGLRREEIAVAAGLSVEYVTRLEQGRATRPSEQVVAALARAFALTDDEAALLHRAAGLVGPVRRIGRTAPKHLEALVARLDPLPAALYTADWWLLRWNGGWADLLGDPAVLTDRDRNLAWQLSTRDDWPIRPETDRTYRAVVSDLRALVVEHPDDAALRALVDDLMTTSAEFRRIWGSGEVVPHRSETKRLHGGPATITWDMLRPAGTDVRLVLYTTD